MIATTVGSGDVIADLEATKKVEITGCNHVGKFRNNRARPISVTFKLCDDKELFLSCKCKLPAGIYENEEYPIHVKRTWDKLLSILTTMKRDYPMKSLPTKLQKNQMISTLSLSVN